MTKNYHIEIPKNEHGRDFVIGDIHARKKRFKKALDSVNFDKEKDRLFALGDLIDRGKDAIFILNELRNDWFYSICGNHEQLLLNRFDLPLVVGDSLASTYTNVKTRHDAVELHKQNSGRWFDKLRSTAQLNIYLALSKLPLAMTLETDRGKIGLVHAQVPDRFDSWHELLATLDVDDEVKFQAVWDISAIQNKSKRVVEGIDLVVHGHFMVPEPVVDGNQVWIDTGHTTGALTILEVNELFDLIEAQDS